MSCFAYNKISLLPFDMLPLFLVQIRIVVLPILVYVKHVTPGRGYFKPQGINLNKLVRDLQGDATYQISKL